MLFNIAHCYPQCMIFHNDFGVSRYISNGSEVVDISYALFSLVSIMFAPCM